MSHRIEQNEDGLTGMDALLGLAVSLDAELEASDLPSRRKRLGLLLGMIFRDLLDDAEAAGRYLDGPFDLESDPDPSDKNLHLLIDALRAFQSGAYSEALDLAHEAWRDDPDDPSLLLALALILRRTDRVYDLMEVIGKGARHVLSPFNRLALLKEQGQAALDLLSDPELASECFTAAAEMDPKDLKVHHGLASAALAKKDFLAAVEHLGRAVENTRVINQKVALLTEMGEIYRRDINDLVAAESCFWQALNRDPGDPRTMGALADLYRHQQRWSELLSIVELMIEAGHPDEAALHLEAARLSLYVDPDEDGKRAESHFRAVLEIAPDNLKASEGLLRLLRSQGRWEDLLDVVSRLAVTPSSMLTRAEALDRLGRFDDLVGLLTGYLEDAPDGPVSSRLARRLAEICSEKLGDQNLAHLYFLKAYALCASDPLARHAYKQHLVFCERWDVLLETLHQELKHPKSDPVLLFEANRLLGWLLAEKLRRPSEAVKVLEAARKHDPEDAEVLALLDACYDRLDKKEELTEIRAVRARVITQKQDQVEVLMKAASRENQQKNPQEALALILDAFRLDPARREVFTAAEHLCYSLKAWDSALEIYDEAIDLVEVRGSHAYRLADLYSRKAQIQLHHLDLPAEAAASYLRVLELDPENDTAMRFLESIYAGQEDWEGLKVAYEYRAELLTDEEKRVETLRRGARVAQAKLVDPSETVRLYEQIIKIVSTDEEALTALESGYERLKDRKKLVDVLLARLSVSKCDRERTALNLRLGRIHEDGLGDCSGAIRHYQAVLELVPDHRESLDALSRVFEALGRWNDYIDVVRNQIRLTKDRQQKALLHFKCGSVLENQFHRTEDALRYYITAIQISPSCQPALSGLRDIYTRRQDWVHVLKTMEMEARVRTVPSERAGVLSEMAQILLTRLSDPKQAKRYYEIALETDPRCLAANRALFEMAYAEGLWEEAQQMARSLRTTMMRHGDPVDRSEFYRKMGMVADHTGSLMDACSHFLTALEIWPENLAALGALTHLCCKVPDACDIEAALEELTKLYEKKDLGKARARALVAKGALQANRLDLEGAQSCYLKALDLDGTDLLSVMTFVDLLLGMGRHEEAIRCLLDFAGGESLSYTDRLEGLMRAGEIAEVAADDMKLAAEIYRKAGELCPESLRPQLHLARICVIEKDLEKARSTMEEVIATAEDPIGPEPPAVTADCMCYLGRILMRLGRLDQAEAAFRKALTLQQGHPEAAAALSRILAGRSELHEAKKVLQEALKTASRTRRADGADLLGRSMAALHLKLKNNGEARRELEALAASGRSCVDDRLTLARLCLMEGGDRSLKQALDEIQIVLDENLMEESAIRLLVSVYEAMSDTASARRSSDVLRLLGFKRTKSGSSAECARISGKKETSRPAPMTDFFVSGMDESNPKREPTGQLYDAIGTELQRLYPSGPSSIPKASVKELLPEDSIQWVEECLLAAWPDLEGKAVELLTADKVPSAGSVSVLDDEVEILLDESVVEYGPSAVAFVAVRALLCRRAGYELLGRLGPDQRNDVGFLLRALARPEEHRPRACVEFLNLLPRRKLKAVLRTVAAASEKILRTNPADWLSRVDEWLNRLALYVVDDLDGSLMGLALVRKEKLLLESASSTGFPAVLLMIPGADLMLRSFLHPAFGGSPGSRSSSSSSRS